MTHVYCVQYNNLKIKTLILFGVANFFVAAFTLKFGFDIIIRQRKSVHVEMNFAYARSVFHFLTWNGFNVCAPTNLHSNLVVACRETGLNLDWTRVQLMSSTIWMKPMYQRVIYVNCMKLAWFLVTLLDIEIFKFWRV